MPEKKELNIEELQKATGGKFDEECYLWYYRNRKALTQRAVEKNLINEEEKLSADLYYSETEVITLDIYKQRLKEIGLDCDDLM